MKKVYSYIRFSSTKQAFGDSHRRQSKAIQDWLANHPDHILDESLSFEDLGRSAFHGDHLKEGGALRAFLEALRNQISWNVLLMNSKRNITFSIGISRYPQNGSELEIVNKKLYRAMDIVHERGRNRYIIYREHLHGDIS